MEGAIRILLLATASIAMVTASCDYEGIATCYQQFQHYSRGLEAGLTWSRNELETICEVFVEAYECSEPFISGCPKPVMDVLNGPLEGFKMLCEDPGKSTYLEHADCFSQPSFNDKILTCNKTASEATSRLQEESSDAADLYKRSCDILNGLLSCSVGATKDSCGQDAASFMLNILQVVVEGAASKINCELLVTVDSAQYTAGLVPLRASPAVLSLLLSLSVVRWFKP